MNYIKCKWCNYESTENHYFDQDNHFICGDPDPDEVALIITHDDMEPKRMVNYSQKCSDCGLEVTFTHDYNYNGWYCLRENYGNWTIDINGKVHCPDCGDD